MRAPHEVNRPRLLRDAAESRQIGDTTTLADTMVMQTINDRMRARAAAAKA